MQFDLNEIGITLVVGAFTILTVEMITWYIFGRSLTGFFKDRLGLHGQQELHVAVFLALCYAVGLLSEDMFSNYVDVVDRSGASVRLLRASGTLDDLEREPDEEALKRSTLQNVTIVRGLHTAEPSPTNLARELVKYGIFASIDDDRGRRVQAWLDRPTQVTDAERDEITRSIGRVWYAAKNRIFREDNYYDEMKQIRRRQMLTRTIATVALLGAWAAATLGGLVALTLFVAQQNAAFKTILRERVFRRHDARKFLWRHTYSAALVGRFALETLGRVLVLVVIFQAALWSYAYESLEYNKRVFGYYASLVEADQRSLSR